jgi:membrane protein implicated in regulation of membrane protease activity
MIDSLFTPEALLFTIPALLGTMVFLLKLGLLALGAGADSDVDVPHDVDIPHDVDMPHDVDAPHDIGVQADAHDALHHGDSTAAFTYLSIQGIAAFVMGFGWGGLIGLRTLDWGMLRSIGLGVIFGAFLMWLLGILLRAVYSLQESGNIRIADTVGCEGVVYTNIPGAGEGRGSVRVIIGDRARLYNAVTEGEGLATKTRIRVTRANRDNSVTVVRA